MKKLFFSVCAASLLLFSACSKDDDKDASEMSSAEISSMIVGTWQTVQDEWIEQEGDWKDSGVDNYDEIGIKETMTFNSDKTWTLWTAYEEDDIPDEDTDTGKWRIENNTLILYDDESDEEWVIEKLTKDELILSQEEREEDYYWFERWYLKR